MQRYFHLVALGLLIGLGWGCSTDFEVYAPEKEIRSVYCVLNPLDSVQYIRIAKAYQYRGDAYAYAAANDLSVKGLQVKITGNGKTWTAIEDTVTEEAGIFLPTHTIYKIVTNGVGVGHDTIAANHEYTLQISTPDAADYVTAKTFIPDVPRIKGELQLTSGAGNSKCLPSLYLDRKFNWVWKKVDQANANYELRVGLRFATNGIEQEIQWGPTKLFNTNQRCNEGNGNICYQFPERDLLKQFLQHMPELPLTSYTYVTHDSCVANPSLIGNLPKSLWFEVTAVDEFLSNYMIVNDPSVTDLTGARPEYTNLTGNIKAVGVFGSFMADRSYAIMRQCSEALLGLNGERTSPTCNWD